MRLRGEPASRFPNCSGWLAFTIYLALSLLFFGRGLIGHLSDRFIGIGTDPGLFIFFLEWWKYVFIHHVNPFLTYLQWAPSGSNLAWATCIPLFGIAAIPLTAALGPIATFNLLTLLCLPLAAWTAFLLCRYLCSSSWAALIGGYVFGFSPWMLCHLLGHLTVLMMFPVPLMVLTTLRRLNTEISTRAFAVTLTTWIVALFLCWPEAVATATLFGGIAIAIAWMIAPHWRNPLQALILPATCAYIASAIFLGPYLYYFFAFGQPAFPGGMRFAVAVPPLNFLIPSTTILLGTFPLVGELLSGGHIYETGSYLALPMIFIVVMFARSHWDDCRTRLLVLLLIVISVASLGTALRIPNHRSIPMPWAVLSHLPLIDKALPARFSVFSFLTLAAITGMWLCDDATSISVRVTAAMALIIFTLPNLSADFWVTPTRTPAFFSNRLYTRYVSPGDNILILPYGEVGLSNIWQAGSEMYFNMAGGYVGPPPMPAEYLPYFPLVYDFFNLAESPYTEEILKLFLIQKNVKEIVIADDGLQLWRNSPKSGLRFPEPSPLDADEKASINSLFSALGVSPFHIGGVSIYKVPLGNLTGFKNMDPRNLEARGVSVQFDALLNAADRYLAAGHPLSQLSPLRAQSLGLLPPRWISGTGIFDPNAPIKNGLVLSAANDRDVLVGVLGAHDTIENLASQYRPYAKIVETSSLIEAAAWVESSRWILLLECDRDQLALAARFARQHLDAGAAASLAIPPSGSGP